MAKEKNWLQKHSVWTIIIGFFLVMFMFISVKNIIGDSIQDLDESNEFSEDIKLELLNAIQNTESYNYITKNLGINIWNWKYIPKELSGELLKLPTLIKTCGTMSPSNLYYIIETNTILFVNADNYNIMCDFVDREESSDNNFQNEINFVGSSISGLPDLNIRTSNLKAMNNPKGEGVLIYVPETQYFGIERFFMWVVINNNAYAVNGASKDLTPSLPFPREASVEVWARTGLEKYVATDTLKIVFG